MWTKETEGESINRTVSCSHSVTSLEKEAGRARKDCTKEKSGIWRETAVCVRGLMIPNGPEDAHQEDRLMSGACL